MTTSKPKGQNMTNPNTTQGIIAIIVLIVIVVFFRRQILQIYDSLVKIITGTTAGTEEIGKGFEEIVKNN